MSDPVVKGPPTPAAAPAAAVERSLYEQRSKIYPREVHGLFAFMRTTGVVVLLAIYFLTAWINWEGKQVVLWDLPARKFHLFGLTFWPQDFIFLTGMLTTAALALFLFTAVAGRLWCGYACPQTVWTELFLWVERRIEGSRVQQMRLDSARMSWDKLWRKSLKHALWLAIAFYTGFTFIGYFTPIRELTRELATFSLGPWETFWIGFFTLATYGNAGWMREQVCKYMCPYARFQSAMFDKDTLIVSYDAARGEPRGARPAQSDHRAAGMGDCVDCRMCVQVCPTGIDIRKGLQYECIGCSACVDACNSVMAKLEYPPGLIRYTTQRALEGGTTRILRPRILAYAGFLCVLLGVIAWGVANRSPLLLDVIRDRNQLFREYGHDRIENVYTLRIINKSEQAREFALSATGLPGIEIDYDAAALEVAAGAVLSMPVRVRVREDDLGARSSSIVIAVHSDGPPPVDVRREARFLGPAQD